MTAPNTLESRRLIRAIEDSFPIVEINRLAIPERNSFKPIYQMHKWFARRASCVFRAILLGCLKPLPLDESGKPIGTGAQVIMDEFYRDHGSDPDTTGKVVLDPFMGGGTTVVEALRLGCRVVGIDLNPVSWFIVKTEVERVELEKLKGAFERLAERKVGWSGRSVRETLLDQYRTECPCCGTDQAEVMYTFWVKSAICAACHNHVPLFKDYFIAQKSPSIRYWRDAECPSCRKAFDLEIEPAVMVAEPSLQLSSQTYSAGAGRSTARWAFSAGKTVQCPWCEEVVTARPSKSRCERKKIPLTVVSCPHCESVWQWRGEVPTSLTCVVCKKEFDPQVGNVPSNGKYLCPSCGHTDDIIRAIRRLPDDELLPIHPYGVEGYCPRCSGGEEDKAEDSEGEPDLFGRSSRPTKEPVLDHPCRITKNGGKFFKRIAAADLRRIEGAVAAWREEMSRLPYPTQAIRDGQETHRLLEHHYRYWHQMFHPRQLLCLATLLEAIRQEADHSCQDLLLSTFQVLLERNNLFCRYFDQRNTVQGAFARHDFQPKNTPAESSVWGRQGWRGTVPNLHARTLEGKRYAIEPYDLVVRGGRSERRPSGESVYSGQVALRCGDARQAQELGVCDIVVTDPPYVGNVNYAELSDFFYVWLRLALSERYECFGPEETPKQDEIIENRERGKTKDDFASDLTDAFRRVAGRLREDGLLVFTFHHAEGEAWESVLRATFDAGLEIVCAYPVHGEKESSSQLMDTQGISYDLIHVCRRRQHVAQGGERRSWAGVRQEIRRRAREEVAAIERGRYGNDPLSPSDVNIVLIGKCLEVYSRHYGAVGDLDEAGQWHEVRLHEALKQIRDIADQMVERARPLPSELEDVDPESRVYLRALCGVREIKGDDVHKVTRGILEPSDLIKAGLMTRMRAGRGRTYEVKQPNERLRGLMEHLQDGVRDDSGWLFAGAGGAAEKRDGIFIDRVHVLLGLAESGENVVPWLERFRGETPQIRAALLYMEGRNKNLAPACKKVLGLIDVGPLFKGTS